MDEMFIKLKTKFMKKIVSKLLTKVIAMHIYSCFDDLYRDYDKVSLGYSKDEDANPIDMEKYYSKEEQEKYGVVGIEIMLI